MKIVRHVNGKVMEFELTPEELFAAFLETEHIYDKKDVVDGLVSFDVDESTRLDFENIYGVPVKAVLENEAIISRIAYAKRNMQDNGMNQDNARDEALRDVLSWYQKFKVVAPVKESLDEQIAEAQAKTGTDLSDTRTQDKDIEQGILI